MPNKPFKVHERNCAKLVDGWRYPANTGGPVDVESEHVAMQCKLVQEMSLSVLTAHTMAIDREARKRGKKGALAIKLRAGKGVATPTLICLLDTTFREMFPSFQEAMKEIAACANPEPPPASAPGVTVVKPKETRT